MYNPKAVVSLMTKGRFRSYWSETGSYEVVVPLICMNYDGLKNAIIEMLSGSEVKVDTGTFKSKGQTTRLSLNPFLVHT